MGVKADETKPGSRRMERSWYGKNQGEENASDQSYIKHVCIILYIPDTKLVQKRFVINVTIFIQNGHTGKT